MLVNFVFSFDIFYNCVKYCPKMQADQLKCFKLCICSKYYELYSKSPQTCNSSQRWRATRSTDWDMTTYSIMQTCLAVTFPSCHLHLGDSTDDSFGEIYILPTCLPHVQHVKHQLSLLIFLHAANATTDHHLVRSF